MVDSDRLGVPSVLTQGQHQQVVQPFPERVNIGEPQQLSDRLVMAAKAQVQIDKRFQCPQPQLGQARKFTGGQPFGSHTLEWLTTPQRQGGTQQVRGAIPVAVRSRLPPGALELLEPGHVEATLGYPNHVAAGNRSDQVVVGIVERPAQPLYVVAHGGGGRRRWLASPQRLHQDVGGHRPVRVEQQHGEQYPLLTSRHPDLGPRSRDNQQRAEQEELHARLYQPFTSGATATLQRC